MPPSRAIPVATRSPVSDGGRGLKRSPAASWRLPALFARQRWRAWIETTVLKVYEWSSAFARQRWRAWIETIGICASRSTKAVRPSAMAGVD